MDQVIRTRDKKSAEGLLPRMEARQRKDGLVTYRYHPLGAKPISLGTDKAEAIRKVLDLNGRSTDEGTFNHLWRIYRESDAWKVLAARTQLDYAEYSVPLLKVFGVTHVGVVRPADFARYLRRERAEAPKRANREMALASNLCNVAIELGYIDANPCKQVRRNKETPRKAIPIAAELDAFLTWLRGSGKQWIVIAAMGEFAAKAGSRRTEFLRATVFQVRDNEARLQRAKQRDDDITDVIDLSPEVVATLASIRREGCEYLFPTRANRPYTDAGFKAMWSKAMAKAVALGIVTRRFTFHDLRAHYATTHKLKTGLLPDLHRDPGTTATIYDRAKEVRRKAI